MIALSETTSTITINGWQETVTISKDAISSLISGHVSDTVMTVANQFTVQKNSFFSQSGCFVTGFQTTPYAQSIGTDHYGTYFQLTLNLKGKPTNDSGAQYTYSLRFRFYDGRPLFEWKVITESSGADHVANVLNMVAGKNAQTRYASFLDTYAVQTPMSVWTPIGQPVSNPTSGWMAGHNFYSNDNVGVCQYLDPTSTNYDASSDDYCLLEWSWYDDQNEVMHNGFTATITANAISTIVYRRFGGGIVTLVPSYRGCMEFSKWTQRDRGTLAYTKGQLGITYMAWPYTGTTGYYNGFTYGFKQDDFYNNELELSSKGYPISTFLFDASAIRFNSTTGGWEYSVAIDTGSSFANYRGTGKNLAQWAKDKGYIPGCWINLTGGDPNLIASSLVGMGFKYVKIDGVAPSIDNYFSVKKIIDSIKALDPTFFVEVGQAYLSSLSDSFRTNDFYFIGDDVYQTVAEDRYKFAMAHAPNKVIDCCGIGTTYPFKQEYSPGSDDGEGNVVPDTPASHTTTAVIENLLNIQFGYGRGNIYFTQYILMHIADINGVLLWGQWFADQFAAAESQILEVLHQYANLPAEVPTRNIVGDWETSFDTVLTYSNGNTVTYSAANGLTINTGQQSLPPTNRIQSAVIHMK